MSNSAAKPSSSLPSMTFVVLWFSAWASLSGLLALSVDFYSDFLELQELTARIVASLAVGGAIAGRIFYKPAHDVISRRRWGMAALWGTIAAIVALELGVVMTILSMINGTDDPIPLYLGLIFAPILAGPAVIIVGPACGIALVAEESWHSSQVEKALRFSAGK